MIGETIDSTLEVMGLSNRALARLIKVDVHTITENKTKRWEDLTPNTLKKLGGICFLVTQEYNLYRSSVILEILNQHVFKDTDNKRYSVLTAMISDKFDFETVVSIGRMARDFYKEKMLKSAPSVPTLPDALSA
ncbi:hypothetical protein WDW37_18350 [Bdellovibrionota bacterium FG-1]